MVLNVYRTFHVVKNFVYVIFSILVVVYVYSYLCEFFLGYGMDMGIVYSFPVYENLNLTRHVSKLISNFRCSDKHIKVLILVTSHAANSYRRETIRMTWGEKVINTCQ